MARSTAAQDAEMLQGGEMQVVAFSLVGQLQNFGDERSRWTFHSRIPVCFNLYSHFCHILEFLKNSLQELSSRVENLRESEEGRPSFLVVFYCRVFEY